MNNPSPRLHGWRQKSAAFQTAVLLNLVYFLLGSVIFFFMRLFRYTPFGRRRPDASLWTERKPVESTLDNYQRQF